MVLLDCCIIEVMRFMALLAWIWATDNSAMSAAWSICWAIDSLASRMRAFCRAWSILPSLMSFVMSLVILVFSVAAFCASRRACFAENCQI